MANLRGAALRGIGFFGVRGFFATSFFDAVFLACDGFGLALLLATAL